MTVLYKEKEKKEEIYLYIRDISIFCPPVGPLVSVIQVMVTAKYFESKQSFSLFSGLFLGHSQNKSNKSSQKNKLVVCMRLLCH